MKHAFQWEQIQRSLTQDRLSQAMLFVGPLHCDLLDFINKVMALYLCKSEQLEACFQCPDCQMVARGEHPDVAWIKPEKEGGSIKIDQIRELQQSAYLTPQRAKFRFIIIDSAERMNSASANALLKILEEPATHTVFILKAQHLSTVVPTIISRCQVLRFSSDRELNNLLQLNEQYPLDSERTQIIDQAEGILDGLIALIEEREHPCILASQWTKYTMEHLLWFFYLVYSQIQLINCNKQVTEGPAITQLNKLASLLSPVVIFNQIDKITIILKKISQNINMNQTLVLEEWLFSVV